VAVRPRKGSVAICSPCHLPAGGYGQLGERRFEFIPLWGFSVPTELERGALWDFHDLLRSQQKI